MYPKIDVDIKKKANNVKLIFKNFYEFILHMDI